jgi:hypothetical protein
MKRIILDDVTSKDMDVLTSEPDDFNLITKSEVRRVSGFSRDYRGKFDGWNDYFFWKERQMKRRDIKI